MSYNYNDPKIWGPYYWFVFHTITLNYPLNQNIVCKKKYYNFIQTIPLLLPNENISNNFANLLDKYPVTPYLDSRESFVKWMHFIHNNINELLEKENMPYETFIDNYNKYYKPQKIKNINSLKFKKTIYFSLLIILILLLIIYAVKNNTI